MAANSAVKTSKKNKAKKNRANKIHLVFDAAKRREFLTGFHKRKLQRKKEAREKLERDLKEERKRLKLEAKESYKKLVVSHRPIPELETLLKEEYEEDDATVRIEELSTNRIALDNHWIGTNQVKTQEESVSEEQNEVPGMGLTTSAKEVQKFDTERDVKRLLKKEATQKVKKSKVFQMKGKMEKQKQKKKSLHQKKQRIKEKIKKSKRKH